MTPSMRPARPVYWMPSDVRIRLLAPSAAMTYSAAISKLRPELISLKVRTACSEVCRTSTASTPRTTRAVGMAARCSRRTDSRWSCGTQAGDIGLTMALCWGEGYPMSMRNPSVALAAVGISSIDISTSTPPARTRSARPQERRISIVRTPRTVARGSSEPTARRSTRRTSMPCRARETAAVSPAGPAPTTTTGRTRPAVSGAIIRTYFHRTICLSHDTMYHKRRGVN